ncbi:hypothetical protein BJF85_07555 [Saccharomonospora sp. CUA-673]|nr:hypothetical protein BJF85_07555 [Saccharomonospora sp. CUA-673]
MCVAVLLVVGWRRFAVERGWRIAALVAATAVAAVHQLVYRTVPDEAHVGFRYARNIADGYGAVFNPGEYVEGYTDFAWLVLLGLGRALTGGEVETIAVVLGVACVLLTVLVVYALTGRILRGTDPAFAVAAAAVTAGVGSLAAYGPSGLSTPLFVLLVLALVYALVNGNPVLAGVVAALAVMTRLDGLVVAVVAGAWLVAVAASRRVSWSAPAVYLLGAAVLLVPWLAWRMTYYGELVPTAVVAGLSAGSDSVLGRLDEGWTYVVDFALTYQAFLIVAAVAIGVLSYRRGPGARYVWLLLWLAIAEALFVIVAGGPTLPAWGQLAPVPVLLAVAAASGFAFAAAGVRDGVDDAEAEDVRAGRSGAGASGASVSGRSDSGPERATAPAAGRGVALVAVALTGLSLGLSLTRMAPVMHELRDVTDELTDIGAWLGEHLPAGTAVSAMPAGALSAAAGSELFIVDPSGTTDDHLARNPQDHAYVVGSRMPAVVVDLAGGYLPERTCEIRTEYAGPYEVVPFRAAAEGERWVELYLSRPLAAQLTETLSAHPHFTAHPC